MRVKLDSLIESLVGLNTPAKRAIALGVDLILIPLALWLAFFIRLGFDRMINPLDYHWLFIAAPATAIPIFIRLGLYRAVLRYMGRDAITTIFNAVTLSALVLALGIYWMRSDLLIPRMMVFNYWVILFLLVGGTRFAARSFLVPEAHQRRFSGRKPRRTGDSERRKVAIYGAGTAGFQLFRSLQHDHDFVPVAFLDDDQNLHGRYVGGVRVYASNDIETMLKDTAASDIFLAVPSATPTRRKEILASLEAFSVRVKTIPTVTELTSREGAPAVRSIQVEDILGREIVKPHPDLLDHCILNQSVMVTGAGGSIGSELCRQIIELSPNRLVLLDNSEFNLFRIEEELRSEIETRHLNVELVPVLASVVDSVQLQTTINAMKVDTIYHAAAYKHVPIVESNLAAGVRNNVFGTLAAAQSAIVCQVKNFVLISTDKAVRPSNVMGATKRVSEMILQSLSAEARPTLLPMTSTLTEDNRLEEEHRTRFSIVRFGNVVGSSGSVIPKFRRQIDRGGPVTVTHPNVTRYFMTIPEAAQLVIQAGSLGRGGEVFILDMGEAVSILDLAEKMIRLSGLSIHTIDHPEGDVAIQFTGLRPGEKLHEELLIDGQAQPTIHPKIMNALETTMAWAELRKVLIAIEGALQNNDQELARKLLFQSAGTWQDEDPTTVSRRSNEIRLLEPHKLVSGNP